MDWIGCDCHFQNIPNQSRSSLQEVEEVEFERPAKQEEEKSFSRKRDVKEFSRWKSFTNCWTMTNGDCHKVLSMSLANNVLVRRLKWKKEKLF